MHQGNLKRNSAASGIASPMRDTEELLGLSLGMYPREMEDNLRTQAPQLGMLTSPLLCWVSTESQLLLNLQRMRRPHLYAVFKMWAYHYIKRIAAAPGCHRAPPHLASGHQQRLVGPHHPGALGRPTVDPELQDEEGHLPGALRVALPCSASTGHLHEARHPLPEVCGHRPAEALHAGQLPSHWELIRHSEIHHQSSAHAGGQGHQLGAAPQGCPPR
ncbi:uncharacterized protein LOC142826958 [Pelodiscus sinensis]|uniref:uncharacterized protein LOC142826958 n=1 Tax=Pelodiscus sinensis TaxID=13735 RepID=UPI003F6D3C8F